jgi:signal transduction histidine kinase
MENREDARGARGRDPPATGHNPIRVLLIEDSEPDAVLITRELRRGGYEPVLERVETGAAFRAALDAEPWDIVISDYRLPNFNGLAALAELQETGKDIPFILVSGSAGDAMAVAAMRAGAHDYVQKSDLARLPGAVEREIREAAGRTEQAKMREQLVISERMASAGTLAAGVAHEINNPLAAALTNVEFVEGALAAFGEDARAADMSWLIKQVADLHEPIKEAHEALQRVRDIVRDVKLFSRPNDVTSGPVDVRLVLDSSVRMAWNEIRHRARLVKDYGDVPMVQANESRLGQVTLNLIVNAAQAMPEGHARENELRLVTRTGADDCAVIEVSDTGDGIATDHVDRIFDPFFTTKPVGVGTGLGLAICHRIVTAIGGQIEVETERERGTLFRVSLPAALTEAVPHAPSSVPPMLCARGNLLLIDDEVHLGRAIQRALSRHHDLVHLTSGAEALSRIADGARFDVILSDLMMPDMTGMDIHEALSRTAPDQADRMVFLTGGAFTLRARAFLDRVPNPRMDKPFEIPKLLAAIAKAMRHSAGRPGP